MRKARREQEQANQQQHQRLHEHFDNAWLKLGDTSELVVHDMLAKTSQEDVEQPHIHLLNAIRQPENFAFTCKHVLNKELLPFQLAILRELWTRPFPMLIGSRGAGKCVSGDTLVQTRDGICRIDELVGDAPVMERVERDDLTICGENGFRKVAYAWNNGSSSVIRVRTRMGFELTGTYNHPIRRATRLGVEWSDLDKIVVGDVLVVDRTENWHEPVESISPETAYQLGVSAGKQFPTEVLRGSREACLAFIRGLKDSVGRVDGGRTIFHLSSERMAAELQFVLTRLGVIGERVGCQVTAEEPAEEKMDGVLPCSSYHDSVVEITHSECVTYDVNVPDDHSFISNGLVSHNSFCLAVYAVLRALICQGTKIVIVGAAFRQSKLLFEYCEDIWNNAPVLRDLVAGEIRTSGIRHEIDIFKLKIGDSLIMAIPLGSGDKIRGLRANVVLAEEFASIPVEIFENVVQGFAAVSMSPAEKVRSTAKRKAMVEAGVLDAEDLPPSIPGMNSNQTIMSGTAYYGFNHFADYWRRWKAIIESRGDKQKLEEIFAGEVAEKFNWKDFSIVRLPYDAVPDGFLDPKHISKAKATIHRAQFMMEYGAVFPVDSEGFYRRSLIEQCVVGNPLRQLHHPDCGDVLFSAVMRGHPNRHYVIGVDPASEADNFSIIILELWPGHRRVVYGWTTTRQRFNARMKKQLSEGEDAYYDFAARKIRDLTRLFPCVRIAMDSQGGGVAVMEALRSSKNLREGERPILPVIDREDPKDTDSMVGDHIVELCVFSRAEWVSFANHGLRRDMEDGTIFFPCIDSVQLGIAHVEDRITGRVKDDVAIHDTLEDCTLEIETLKDELATIVHTQTGTSLRDRWDTPETKKPGGRKGRLRKDRYSALLMANAVARQYQAAPTGPRYSVMGGFAHEMAGQHFDRESIPIMEHQNPSWYTAVADHPGYGAVVTR